MRLCANTGCKLELIEPLGFVLDDKRLKRAGLDYRERSVYTTHQDFDSYLQNSSGRVFLCETGAQNCYSDIRYQPGDSFVFGPETRGLPTSLLEDFPPEQQIYIPMQPIGSRSLNLSNAVSIVVFEAWRQQNFQLTDDSSE